VTPVVRARGREEELIVQQSFPRPRATTNPYLRLLGDAIARQPGVGVRVFSWRSALTARYDVFHVHWPEILVSGRTPLRALARQLLTALLILRLTVLRVPIVRTLHNAEAHEGLNARQRFLVGLLERRTALVIRLNDFTEVRSGIAVETIPHGHYRDWYDGVAEAPPRERGHVAYVGLIRPYKGVEDLVEAFRDVPGDVRLTAAGKPSTVELRSRLTDLAEADDRIDLELRFLDDDDLVSTVRRAQLVVLPHRKMHNSGSALTALSLDRPVLVPRNEVNDRLAEEVGGVWVQEFSGELTGQDIERALDSVRSLTDDDRPDLSAREWADAGVQHVAAYRRAIVIRKGRSGVRGASE
jgi:beta-1,4-mannosyltransferase